MSNEKNHTNQLDHNFKFKQKAETNVNNKKPNILQSEQSSAEKISPQFHHKNTRFDLDSLKSKNPLEIKKTVENFPFLTQPQRDLIRHQAPDAYAMIIEMQNQAFSQIKKAGEIAQESQFRSSDNAHHTQRSTFNSNKSRDEKRDSYEQNDRKHEREIHSQNQQHSQTLQTVEKVTLITASAIVVGGLIAGAAALLRRD